MSERHRCRLHVVAATPRWYDVPMKTLQREPARAASAWGVRGHAERAVGTEDAVTRTENGDDAEPSTIGATRRTMTLGDGIGGPASIPEPGGAEVTAERRAGGRLCLSLHPFAAGAMALSMTTAVSAMDVPSSYADDGRTTVAASSGHVVRAVHAVGAQIYECKPDGHGSLAWDFREPIATLLKDGETVGRHFAGPSWQMADGSLVVGKVIAEAAGGGAGDVPWLKLAVKRHAGRGILSRVSIVQRIATVGGNRTGPCPSEGTLAAEPYEADYVFSRP